MKSNIKIVKTHISNIMVGDTVMLDGKLTTVGKNNISRCSFMGYSLFGDSSKRIIDKVYFVVPTNKGIILR